MDTGTGIGPALRPGPRLRLDLRGGGVVRADALQPVLEAAYALGEPFAELGQLLRTEKQDGDDQNHQQVLRSQQIFNHKSTFSGRRTRVAANRIP